jgi:hypothetical protein
MTLGKISARHVSVSYQTEGASVRTSLLTKGEPACAPQRPNLLA